MYLIRLDDASDFMDIKNAYEGDLQVDDEQQFLTTKEDTAEHGIGLKNVIKTIEKYKQVYKAFIGSSAE